MPKTPFVIIGKPMILKNNKEIAKFGDKRAIISNERVRKRMKEAIRELSFQWRGEPIDFPISVQIKSYGAWRSGSGNVPDASNLYEFPQDALQAAGVLKDDRIIEHHDGSRRICLCDTCADRPIITRGSRKGQRKASCGHKKLCPYERVEVWIVDERQKEKAEV